MDKKYMRYTQWDTTCMHTRKYYSAMKKELLPFETTRMDLVSIMPYEMPGRERQILCMVSLI